MDEYNSLLIELHIIPLAFIDQIKVSNWVHFSHYPS